EGLVREIASPAAARPAHAAVVDDPDTTGAEYPSELRGISLHLGGIDVHEYVVAPDGVDGTGGNRCEIRPGTHDKAGVRVVSEPCAAVFDASRGYVDADVFARATEQGLGPPAATRPDFENPGTTRNLLLENAAGERLLPFG